MRNKPQQKQKKPRSGKKNKRGNGDSSGMPTLSECAARYAVAIADPWSPSAEGACVPTHPSRPSQKVTAYRKGKVVIGDDGYGFVAVAPSLANDQPCIWHTNSDTFLGSVAACSADMPATGVGTAALSNNPYSYADFVDVSIGRYSVPVSGRIVSAGLSVEYTGTELDRAGNTVCFVDPDHQSVAGLSYSDIETRRESSYETNAAARMKCAVSASGLTENELQYTDPSYLSNSNQQILTTFPYSQPLSTSGAYDLYLGAPMMIIWVTGVKGSTWHYEYVQHSEFIGSKCDPVLTSNVTDAKGFELVSSAASLIPMMKKQNPRMNLRKIMRGALITAAKAATSKAAVAAGKRLLLAAL